MRNAVTLPALLLASGFSRRWGSEDKLLHPVDGVPVLRRTAGALVKGGLRPLWVIVRPERLETYRLILGGLPLRWVVHERAAEGMGGSLAAGAEALEPAAAAGFGVAPADLAWLTAGDVAAVRRAFLAAPERPWRPAWREQPGHPVCFPWSWREKLAGLAGEGGARSLLQLDPPGTIEASTGGVVKDLDQRGERRAGAS